MNLAHLPVAAFLGMGAPELLIILAVLLLLFGGAKLPSLARGLGQSIKEFKKAAKDEDDPKAETKSDPAKKASEGPKHDLN